MPRSVELKEQAREPHLHHGQDLDLGTIYATFAPHDVIDRMAAREALVDNEKSERDFDAAVLADALR